jgi:uncharacterized protein
MKASDESGGKMLIRVKDIPAEGQDVMVNMALSKERASMEGHVTGSVTLQLMAGEVVATAVADANTRLVCSRCLEEFDNGFKINVTLDCVPMSELDTAEDTKQLSGDELDLYFYEDGLLDINRMMEEQVILNIPMQPMCSPECRGLCPSCGQNLNTGPCSCVKPPVDERFHVLRDFISRKTEGKSTNKSKGA